MADKKITELPAYTAPIDTDVVAGVDVTTGLSKKFTWAGIKATLKTYFDTLYATLAGGNFTGAINEKKGADIASATTTDIGAGTGNMVDVTGTTTITGFGTVQAGTRRVVRFTGALILTHHATALILPTGANITTVAGDTATMISLGSGNWVCTSYQRKDGSALLGGSPTYKVGNVDGNGSGTQNIAHGLGKVPSLVTIFSTGDLSGISGVGGSKTCMGAYNGVVQSCSYSFQDDSTSGSGAKGGGAGSTTSYIIYHYARQSGAWVAASITWDATNIILTWSSNGSYGGAPKITWIAQ